MSECIRQHALLYGWHFHITKSPLGNWLYDEITPTLSVQYCFNQQIENVSNTHGKYG